MSALDALIYGYRVLLQVATPLPSRKQLSFGAGFTLTDDDANKWTRVEFVGGAPATDATPGTMSAADKTKLDGMQAQGASVPIAALNIDWSLGGTFSKTLANGANAIIFSNAADGMMITVELTGSGSSAVTWPAGTKFPGGIAPVQTVGGIALYTLVKIGAHVHLVASLGMA